MSSPTSVHVGIPMTRYVMLGLLSNWLLFSVGCDSGGAQSLARVEVWGRVTLDGQPLPAGAIVLHFQSEIGAQVLPPVHGRIENGRYRIPAEFGAYVGTSRVEFRPQPVSREEMEAALDGAGKKRNLADISLVEIPTKYIRNSDLEVTVTGTDANEIDFELSS